ncbi:Karyogamy protein KAR9 [Penicillium fimorum]|uniref:Karyogamy protein KAR9 n=1 Tax=Penicillium fimorum TaxID=1882269 RepID=A0A9W9Y0C1_9EURO|nr:Karyogamy protein KAR9 [Penicillium fimorum]
MHATAESSTFATDLATHPPNTSPTPTSPPSLTPALSVSPNDSGTSTLRRLKSKSSLWSLGSSNNEEEPVPAEPTSAGRTSILRRLSPALAARVKLLDGSNKSAAQNRHANAVGRIPEEHLKELDNLHQDLSIKVKRKGQAWNGTNIPPGETQLKRSASNQLELPHQDILREISDAQRESPESSEAVVDGPELPTPPIIIPVTAQPVENISPPTPMSVAEPVLAQVRAALMPNPQHPNNAQDDRTDFEKYVDDTARREEQSPDEKSAPKPPPQRLASHRGHSIYSFSRASFSNQLSQLTSIPLPQPASLEASIENISTALSAVRALNGAAEQIQIWIKKASDVLSGLDSEDDVEWAAAGGREGLDEVDKAITRFESLVNVYVRAIENVQHRDDIANVDADNLNTIVSQMESILENWTQIKKKLKGVKEQVELAMEWEELWSNVLGDVGVEVDNLSGLIFEMEEKRHQALMDTGETSGGLDINELETIVEESPSKARGHTQNRLSIGPLLASASATPVIKTPQDDTSHSNLMAIFARMQPLRASLEFLPMRLSMFQGRAEAIFPSACEEIEDRRNRLLKSYEVLETDAEALLKELAEDKWILVFRNAGSQAQKMFQSVERSIGKLQDGLESGMQLHNPSTLAKLIESFEQKKMHYVPAIERVVSIIQKGVNDRLTVNGEILRLLSHMESRMDALKASIRVMDTSLEDVHIPKGHQLRDSISSIMTMDSPVTGSAIETPGSSPASSVIINSNGYKRASTPMGGSSRRESSVGSATARSTMPPNRRYSSLPQPTASYTTRKSAIPQSAGFVSPTPSYRSASYFTPTPGARSRTPAPPSTIPNRPRWNASTNLNDSATGYNSTIRKSSTPLSRTPRPSSAIPFPGSFRRDTSASPIPGGLRSTSRISSRLSSRSPSRNVSSPTPARPSLLDPPPYSRLYRQSGMSSTPRSRQSFAGPPTAFSRSVSGTTNGMESPSKSARPGTSLGHSSNRRTSLLPVPKRMEKGSATTKPVDTRPRWR